MLGSGRFLYKQVDPIPRVFNARPKARHCSSKLVEKINIPPRIERGSTDILKALASTVGLDPTAFHYKYPDDPYFYTYSQADKRVYALSLESGRKSAEWIIEKNPGFFKHRLADPPIKAFLQKPDSFKKGKVTEESLLSAIEERDVLRAITAYNILKEKKKVVQSSTKQSLLELACFYNGEEKPLKEPEKKWFQGFLGRAGSQKTDNEKKWQREGFCEGLFQEMDPDCPLAISTIIQGRLKYKEIESALQLYNSAKEKNTKLSVGVYNALLSQAREIVKQKNEIHDFVMEKLSEMSRTGVSPNLGTLNAALKSLSDTNHVRVAGNLVKEFERLGVQPSLGSYGYLLTIFSNLRTSKNKKPARRDVEQIMDEIEGRKHEIRHPSDLDFFATAMNIFAEHFEDCQLALRLHNMYMKPDNGKFMVTGINEHVYYKQLFLIVFKAQPIDFAMDMYRRYVFTCFCPESRVLMAIIQAIHDNFTPQYLVELWGDMEKLAYRKNRPMLARILSLMKDFTDEASLKVFHEAAISFLSKTDDLARQGTDFGGDEEMIPDVLLALAKNNDKERLTKILQLIREKNVNFMNMPESTVEAIMDLAISTKSIPLILDTLRLAVQQDLTSTSELAEKCLPLLSGGDEAWASTLVSQQEKQSRRTETEEKDV